MDNGHDDEHDDCACEACCAAADAAACRLGVGALGGIAPWAHALLGPGWVDEGGSMGGDATTQGNHMPELAARALGDVFQQLSRIGDRGRDRAYPPFALPASGPPALPPPFTRAEALELLRAAEHAIDYGRMQVDWLPRGDGEAPDAAEPRAEGGAL